MWCMCRVEKVEIVDGLRIWFEVVTLGLIISLDYHLKPSNLSQTFLKPSTVSTLITLVSHYLSYLCKSYRSIIPISFSA